MRNITPVTRLEKYLHAIATEEVIDLTPANEEEKLLDAIMRGEGESIEVNPKTRTAYFLAKIAGAHIIGEGAGTFEPAPVKPAPGGQAV